MNPKASVSPVPSPLRSALAALRHARSALALGAALLCASVLPAQSKVGIYVSRGPVTLSGILCGFDCMSPANTGRATAMVFDVIDVRLLGAMGQPGYLFLAVGPTLPCPGLPLFGITNNLLLHPGMLFPVAFGLPSLAAAARGTCGETGLGIVLGNLQIPPGTSGGVVAMQGLAVDGGAYHFTRPIELTIQ